MFYRRFQQRFHNQQQPTQNVFRLPSIVLSITLLPSGEGWRFQWQSIGDPYYRIVLFGEQLDAVKDNGGTLTYDYIGIGFDLYPPPLEVVGSSAGLAASELNKPYLTIQWYANQAASYYEVQEYIDSDWSPVFRIAEIGTQVYTWVSLLLDDESDHQYRVVAFNELDQASSGLEFNITPVVTPYNFIETDYTLTYDGTLHQIVLDNV